MIVNKDAIIENFHAPGDKDDTIALGDYKSVIIHISKKRAKTGQHDLTCFCVTGHHAEQLNAVEVGTFTQKLAIEHLHVDDNTLRIKPTVKIHH